MGYKSASLVKQVTDLLVSVCRFGESKHDHKADGSYKQYIFSFNTFRNYLNNCCQFVKWCKAGNQAVKTIADCAPYVNDYLQHLKDCCLSASTQKAVSSALAKMYRCTTMDFIKTDSRNRAQIVRSRGSKKMDHHFSEAKNKTLVNFMLSTGLRRCELTKVRGDQLVFRGGKYYIHITGNQSKGGKERYVLVIGNVANVVQLMTSAGHEKVFPHVSSACDVHSYRAEYAAALYKYYARSYEECKRDRFYNQEKKCLCRNALYICRGDMAGQWFDKAAMLMVSRFLGHNRISVIAEHYLHRIEDTRSYVDTSAS